MEEKLKNALSSLHLHYLKPYQELIISKLIDAEECNEGLNLIACLPTGSGKSICFILPTLLFERKMIIIYPLLSLLSDQERRFNEAGIEAVVLKGGMNKSEREERLSKFLYGKTKVLLTNAELLTYLKENGRLKAFTSYQVTLVIDEVHTISSWGRTFRSVFLNLPEIIKALRPKNILTFTATMDEKTERDIIDIIFSGNRPYITHASSDRENIFYHRVNSLCKVADIKKILEREESRPALIFYNSRPGCEALSKRLLSNFDTRFYHAGLTREERKERELWFNNSECGVLVATSAFGMGIDKKNIRTVIHYVLSETALDFIQEAGRGGRDGRASDSYVLFYSYESSPLLPIFKGEKCIRASLLKAMNEDCEERCLACDVCTNQNFKRCGENEILSYIKYHPLKSKRAIIHGMISKKLIFLKPRLIGWQDREVGYAIDELIKEGKIRALFGRLLLKRGKRDD